MAAEGLGPGDLALSEDLVAANHILYRQGVVDGFGHVSARRPEAPHSFLMSRSLAPKLVGPSDVLLYDLDGAEIGEDGRKSYIERFIHSEIYRAQPEVMAVVHSHSLAILPFCVVPNRPLKPVSHMAGFIGEGAPLYEIRDHAGAETDLLIRTPELGRSLARTLGGAAAVLMRGHGSTVVGASLQQAVFRAVYLAAPSISGGRRWKTRLAAHRRSSVRALPPRILVLSA